MIVRCDETSAEVGDSGAPPEAGLIGTYGICSAKPLYPPARPVAREPAELGISRDHDSRSTSGAQLGQRAQENVTTRGSMALGTILGEAAHGLHIIAAARRRLGVLVGGDEGRGLVTAAERWMTDAGIKNVERMTYLVSPCAPRANRLRE